MTEEKNHGFIIEQTESVNESMADIPLNRTMLIQQLTNDAPTKAELTYDLKNVNEVFNHFKPNCKVAFEAEDGGSVNEELKFTNLGDFGKNGITEQSDFLNDLENKREGFFNFYKKLNSNKTLKQLLMNPEGKQAYLEIVDSMIAELSEKTNK